MGISYVTQAGYGFAVNDNHLPEQFADMDNEEFDEWLTEKGYSEITCHWAGNQMCGPTYFFIVADGTHIWENSREFDGVYDMDYELTPLAIEELAEVAGILNYEGTIGVKLIGCVM